MQDSYNLRIYYSLIGLSPTKKLIKKEKIIVQNDPGYSPFNPNLQQIAFNLNKKMYFDEFN